MTAGRRRSMEEFLQQQRAMEAGGVAFLRKPFPTSAVDAALKAARRRMN